MATPVVEAFTTANSGNVEVANIDLTKPVGVAVDELLLLIVGSDNTNASPSWDTVSGWTRFVNIGNSSSDAKLGCYWRIADGTEPATVNVATSSGDLDETWGFYIRISGADTTTPINVVGSGQNTGSASSFAVDQVTTTADDCLAFYALAFDGGDGLPFSVSGTGWTESAEVQADTIFSGASGTWGTRAVATAGSTGTATVTADSSDGATYIQFAVAPGVTALALDATRFEDTDTFGAASLAPGAVALTAALFVDPDTFGVSTVAFPPQDLTAAAFVDSDAFGVSAVVPGAAALTATIFADPDTFGAAQVVGGAAALIGQLFVDPDAFGASVVVPGAVNLTGAIFVDPDVFGVSAVTAGSVVLNGGLFVDPDAFGAAIIDVGAAIVPVVGLPLSTALDDVLVWGEIVPADDPGWTVVGAPPGPVWTDVQLPTSSDWTEIEP